MTENKVKIDLKARLGRASKTGQPSAGARTSQPGPGGIAPPPGIVGGGIPAPIFSAKPTRRGSGLDPTLPFQASQPPPRPQEIKVEIGQEVVQAQLKGGRKLIIAAAISAVAGIGIGAAIGSLSARSSMNDIAVQDAQSLVAPITKAKQNIEALHTKMEDATKLMYKEKKFPESFSKDMTKIQVEFSAADLGGKALHRLKGGLMRDLFDFANDAQELQQRKEALSRLFEARKNDIVDLIEQGKSPKMSYSVFVQRTRAGNAVGTFAPIAKPFGFDDKSWPEEIGLNTGAEVVAAKRYKGGEPFTQFPRKEGEKPTVFAIPLEPDGVVKAFPPRLSQRVEEELKSARQLIVGTSHGEVSADNEKRGLLKLADEILRELATVGAKR